MKWEYACLVRNTSSVRSDGAWSTTIIHTFYGPYGQQEVQGDNSVAILNRLGQDGWEALGVETAYFDPSTVRSTSERIIWLKRPLSTGS